MKMNVGIEIDSFNDDYTLDEVFLGKIKTAVVNRIIEKIENKFIEDISKK